MVLIESLDQISKAIKDRWEVANVAWWCTPWHGTPYSWHAAGESVHHTSVSGYAQSRGDQIKVQGVGCLCPRFLVLLRWWWCGQWSQHMMGRGLERGAGCLDCSKRSWGFPKWKCWRSVLGNLGCSKKSTKNILVNQSEDKRIQSVHIWPRTKLVVCTQLVSFFFGLARPPARTEKVMGWGTREFHEDDARSLSIPTWSGTARSSYMAPCGSRWCSHGIFCPPIKGRWGRAENVCFWFGGTIYLKVRSTESIWANREIPWRLMRKGPHNGFVERLLTHQHCTHRLKNQNWVVNHARERQNPRPWWERNHADSKTGGGEVNVRDKTCSKKWTTEKQ